MPRKPGNNPLLLIALYGVSLLFTCSYPTDSQRRDLLEIERVWQYLKAYSLYSAQILERDQALAIGDPSALVELIPDTLYSHYDDTTFRIAAYGCFPPCCGSAKGAVTAQAPSGASASVQRAGTVIFIQMTPLTAYVRIDSFTVLTADSLRHFSETVAPASNVILDLLMNPGGNLDACTSSIELFLPQDAQYMYGSYRKDPQKTGDTGFVNMEIWAGRRSGDAWEGKRIVILASEFSASAAEIMISGLRNGLGASNALVLGTPTFGKAIGQYSFCLWRTSGAGLVLTGFRFIPITGAAYDYNEKGIQPDVEMNDRNWWNLVAAAGNILESEFSSKVDGTIISLFNKNYTSTQKRIPSCYKQIPDRETPLF